MRPSRRQAQPFVRRWPVGRLSVTAVLVALGVGAYAAQWIAQVFLTDVHGTNILREWLALDGAGVRAGQYWKFFTFQFLHADPFHLAANMLLLYFAGREVEPIIGSRHFLALFAAGNLFGGATQWLASGGAELVGVSAGVGAVIIAFTTILPELEVTVHLFFVLPVRLRAKHLAVALVALATLCALTGHGTVVGAAGIVAASAFSWAYIKQLGYGNPLAIQRYIFEKRQRVARLQRMSPEQFISAEIDPILEKISRLGMHSLTRDERKILAQGREKIANRTAKKSV